MNFLFEVVWIEWIVAVFNLVISDLIEEVVCLVVEVCAVSEFFERCEKGSDSEFCVFCLLFEIGDDEACFFVNRVCVVFVMNSKFVEFTR